MSKPDPYDCDHASEGADLATKIGLVLQGHTTIGIYIALAIILAERERRTPRPNRVELLRLIALTMDNHLSGTGSEPLHAH